MLNASTMNLFSKKVAFMAATLVLALGMATSSVSTAQAGGRDGRIIAGAIAGAALLAIIASERRDRKRYRRKHQRSYYNHRGNREYRNHRRWRKSDRRHRGHRRDYW